MPSDSTYLEVKNLSFSYMDGFVLQGITFSVARGDMLALLGPNGSGKTTLLKLACGLFSPRQGEIRLEGRSLYSLRRREIARQVAVMPQQFHMPFAFTAREVVMLGRTPFLRPLSEESREDRLAVAEAMEFAGVSSWAHRPFSELSGGERQKVILAMALAQAPKLLFLDEPTAHLDINHQVEILEVIRRLNRERGLTVVAAMHDLNLAALYFPRLILLREGRLVADGAPAQVLTEERICQVFGATVKVEPHPSSPAPHIILLPPMDSKPG